MTQVSKYIYGVNNTTIFHCFHIRLKYKVNYTTIYGIARGGHLKFMRFLVRLQTVLSLK